MVEPQYYKILGVKPTASLAEIKKAYHSLAKKYHPDINHGDHKAEEKLKSINMAYDILKNDISRSLYDAQIAKEEAQKKEQYQPHPTPQNQPIDPIYTTNKKSWKRIIIHEIFALLCLFLYGWLLYINTDKNEPYNITKTLRNTGDMLIENITSAKTKIEQIYHNNPLKKNILFFVTQQNQPKILDTLLEYWPNANETDDKGYSLLMYAPNAQTARVLLKHQANINYAAPDGQTALSQAIIHERSDIVNLLHSKDSFYKKQ